MTAAGESRGQRTYAVLDAGGIATLFVLLLLLAPMLSWALQQDSHPTGVAAGFELRALCWTALIAAVLPVVQITLQIRQLGGGVVRGNRERALSAHGVAGRIARAHANMVEALCPFAAVVLVAHAAGVSNRWTVAASATFLAARALHAATYAAGITVIRSAAFYAGTVATCVIAIQVLLGST